VERVLQIPIPIKSEGIASISKARWMRYTLRLVKETGENVKNLEIIGLYKIPKQGVKKISHNASDGTIHIQVGVESINCNCCVLVLAKRKKDNSMFSYSMDTE
jgi:hypothetical protein